MLDLNDFKNLEAALPLVVKHPVTKEDTTAKLWLYSNSSRHSINALVDISRKRGDLKDETEEQKKERLEVEDLTYLAKMTAKWEGIFVDKEELECTEENVVKFYSMLNSARLQATLFIKSDEYAPK